MDYHQKRAGRFEHITDYEVRKYLAALAAVRTGDDYWDALQPWRDDRDLCDLTMAEGLVESIPDAHDAPWIRVTPMGIAVLYGAPLQSGLPLPYQE
jgi:hypothetical protein